MPGVTTHITQVTLAVMKGATLGLSAHITQVTLAVMKGATLGLTSHITPATAAGMQGVSPVSPLTLLFNDAWCEPGLTSHITLQ
jgi:hypothetical protein